jgi:hypothetical protein
MHLSGTIDFQSHTHGHCYIPRWPEPVNLEGCDPELIKTLRGPEIEIAEDFRKSKDIFLTRLGKNIRHLAFPKYNGSITAVRIGKKMGYKAFWWGVRPHRSGNMPGQSPSYIVRLKSEFLQRLPGKNRKSLKEALCRRFKKRIRRKMR